VLFQSLVFVGALGETLFFRGILQDQRGILISVLAAGASSVLFFWPAASHAPVYLVAAALFTTVLAGVYSFVRTRYGLAAAYVCQVTVNLMLLFVPSLL
jgi:membrane protease YdiL (CAAX protease family)